MTFRLKNAARVFLAACSLSLFAVACAEADQGREPSDDGGAVEVGALPDTSLAPTGTCIQNCIQRLNSCLNQGHFTEEQCYERHDTCVNGCGGGPGECPPSDPFCDFEGCPPNDPFCDF